MNSAQARLTERQMREERLDAIRIALSIATAFIAATAIIGFYIVLTTTLAAMPDIIAQSAARRAW